MVGANRASLFKHKHTFSLFHFTHSFGNISPFSSREKKKTFGMFDDGGENVYDPMEKRPSRIHSHEHKHTEIGAPRWHKSGKSACMYNWSRSPMFLWTEKLLTLHLWTIEFHSCCSCTLTIDESLATESLLLPYFLYEKDVEKIWIGTKSIYQISIN